MARVFDRGELRRAVLAALAEIEPANGYTIMQALSDAIGGTWRASPGAVFPAILSLEDAGLVVGTDDGSGSRSYRLSEAGRRHHPDVSQTLATVANRASHTDRSVTLRSLLDDFATGLDRPTRRLDPATAKAITHVLGRATTQLEQILDKEPPTNG